MSCYTGELPEEEEPDFSNQKIEFEQRYKEEDLFPTEKDPNCDPEWPLAAYWPVYVSNFFVSKWEESFWFAQVSQFFAHKGLMTRMIYFHKPQDKAFEECQQKLQLVDMLVYFTSRKDAIKALETCHREMYCGYHLNVVHGRRPEYFDNDRTVQFLLRNQTQFLMSDSLIEIKFKAFGNVEATARTSADSVYMQFATAEEMIFSVSYQLLWKPFRLKKPVMMQRFIESDVKKDIELKILSNPLFMDMKPAGEVRDSLFKGHQPKVNSNWRGQMYPKRSAYAQQWNAQSLKEAKETVLTTAKKRVSKGTLARKSRKMKSKMMADPNQTAVDFLDAKSANKQRKERIRDTLDAVNFFRQMYNHPPMSISKINKYLKEKDMQRY